MKLQAGQYHSVCLSLLDLGMLIFSSVDDQTQGLMQSIIDSDFNNTTVLAILHRMEHIQKYDKVALFDHGRMLEFGRCDDLVVKGNSKFAELYQLH